MGYIAFVPNEASRRMVLQNFPPKFPDVICHHVTLEFGVPPERLEAVRDRFDGGLFEVKGIVSDEEKLEALIVYVNCVHTRPDGGIYHMTHSLDRSKGAKPVHSNELVKQTSNWKMLNGWINLVGTIEYFN